MTAEQRCAACACTGLVVHLRVGGGAGPDGLIPTTSQFGTALADIVRCRRCGHMQTEPMPAEAELAGAYAVAASADYVQEEAGQRATAARELSRIERHCPDPGALLDVGCWVGYLVSEAERRGWRATGLEPSSFAAAHAREQLRVEVIEGELSSVELPAHGYDVVTMGDVIEHLAKPELALTRIAGLLRPGGLLWLAVPDAGSRLARIMGRHWWSVIPTHVQYFTRGSLATLLTRCGFDPVEATTSPKAFSVRYYLSRAGGYSPAVAAALVGAAERARIAERMWAPDFGDRMAVIARMR